MLKIRQNPAPVGDYYQDRTIKNLFILHMTAGLGFYGIDGTLDQVNHINVHYLIMRDGTVYQNLPEDYWAFNTGDRGTSMRGISVELEGWCDVVLKNGKFYSWTGKEVPSSEVIKLNKFRGKEYFQTLTPVQKTALWQLFDEVSTRHPIPKIMHKEKSNLPISKIKGIVYHSVISDKRLDYPPDYPME